LSFSSDWREFNPGWATARRPWWLQKKAVELAPEDRLCRQLLDELQSQR